MRPAVVLLAVLLSGCVAESPSRLRTIALDEPAFESILPGVEDLPPGFTIGWDPDVEPSGPSDAVSGRGRVFDYTLANSTIRHMVQASVQRYESPEDVATAFAQFKTRSEEGEVMDVDQNLTMRRIVKGTIEDPTSYWNHTMAFGRTDLYIVWVGEAAQGDVPLTDPVELVRGMLLKLEAPR